MVEEKLRAMDRDLVNTQVVVHLQEEGTENLSLQDEEGQFLHVIPQFLLLMVMSLHGVLKTKEAELQQLLEADSEPVQEGPMASTASDKPLSGGIQLGGGQRRRATTTTHGSFRTSPREPSDINCR